MKILEYVKDQNFKIFIAYPFKIYKFFMLTDVGIT